MDSLVEILTLEDLGNKIVSLKEYTRNLKVHAPQMKAFLPLIGSGFHIPIRYGKYGKKICYIDWILRSDELYLSLNVTYYSTGLIKSVEAVSQQLALTELNDLRNIRTLAGKRFKRKYQHDKSIPAYSVVTERIIDAKPFAITDGGMDHFAMRDKILKKFSMEIIDATLSNV